ncbi:MAG: hypothetical protein IPI31_00255 [Bacteroidetes bacterium]|nr:hypothetical protein [Bacteroidota bacterium]
MKNFKSIRWSNSECPNGSIKLETSIPKSEDTINGTLNTDVNQNADSQNSKQQVDLAATADFILLPNSDDFKYFNIYDGLSIKNLPDYFNNIFDIRAIDNKINTLAEYKTILEINNVPQNSYAIRLKIPSSNIAFSNEHVSISDIDVVCVRKEKGNNKDWIVYQISYIVNLSDDVSERNGEIGDLIRNHVESEFGLIKNKAHYYDNGMVQYVASNKNYQFILTYGGENRTTGKPIISVAINYQQ